MRVPQSSVPRTDRASDLLMVMLAARSRNASLRHSHVGYGLYFPGPTALSPGPIDLVGR